MCGHTDADFGALDVEPSCDVRRCGQDKRVRARDAGLHDVECEVVDTGVVRRCTDVGDDERHEELLHRLFEGIKLVDCLRGFRAAPNGVARLGRVEDKGIVFERCCGKLDDAGLRVVWMYFKSHVGNVAKRW